MIFFERELSRWDKHFLDMCELVASMSKDDTTKVGAVIVGHDQEVRATGFNSFPRGINDLVPERQIRPLKYNYFEHAERNAIYNAARVGTPLKGTRLYVPWHPCADCARAIIQSGIKAVILSSHVIPEHWKNNCLTANEMLREAGVVVTVPPTEESDD